MFEVLADSRRRIVLEYLQARIDDPVSDQLLVHYVTEIESEAVDGSVPLEYPEYVRENLRHAVLPELARRGIIEYDRLSGTVRYRGHALIDEFLQLVDPAESTTCFKRGVGLSLSPDEVFSSKLGSSDKGQGNDGVD